MILGFAGAVLIPVLYEIYANVSPAVGLFLAAAWVVFAGLKFSFLDFKEAFIGITCTIAYSGILGMVCYFIIHPKIQQMLLNSSVYFQLSLKEKAYFLLYIALIFLCMYLVWLGKFGVCRAVEKIRSNSEKTGEYIDNAFNDNNEEDF